MGLFVAYALLIEVLASPFLRAQAAQHLQSGGSLAILCQSDGSSGQDDPAPQKQPHGHGLDCCLPGLRFIALDTPLLVVSSVAFALVTDADSRDAEFILPQSRAPPVALKTVLQPRAPPTSIV